MEFLPNDAKNILPTQKAAGVDILNHPLAEHSSSYFECE